MNIGRSRERGVAVVEFALVLPLLVTILFGAIDFGFVSNDTTKLRQVVRETGRRASVWRFGRSVCEDSPSGEVRRGRLVQNHEVVSGAVITQPAVAVYETAPSRILEARLLQCQLRLLGLEAGLDVRTKILVASFPAESTGLETVTAVAKPYKFVQVNADPNPPMVDPSPILLPNGTCYATPPAGTPHSGDIGRVFDDKDNDCVKDANEAESDVSFTVVICAQYRTKSRTGFFGPLLNDKILRSTVAMRVARLNAPPTPFYPGAVEEEPLTIDGKPGNWDSCHAKAA
jgi:TadE-like protein